MQGRNELHLCGAEMAVAVQEYLNKRMGQYAPKVAYITFSNPVPGNGGTFVVSFVPGKTYMDGLIDTPPAAPPT